MKTATLFFCVLVAAADAGTFRLESTTTKPLIGGSGINSGAPRGSVTVNVGHVYDEDTLELIDADWSWVADTISRTITRTTVITPPIFPNPAVTETKSVQETIEILSWPRTTNIIEINHAPRPFWHPGEERWMFGFDVEAEQSQLEIRRTIVGPESTSIQSMALAPNEGGPTVGRVRNIWDDEENAWTAEAAYVTWDLDRWFVVPAASHDGVPIGGLKIRDTAAIVIPEPATSLWLLLLLLPILQTSIRAKGIRQLRQT